MPAPMPVYRTRFISLRKESLVTRHTSLPRTKDPAHLPLRSPNISPAVPVPAIRPTLAGRLSSSLNWNRAPIQYCPGSSFSNCFTLSVCLPRFNDMVNLVYKQACLLADFGYCLPCHAHPVLKGAGLLKCSKVKPTSSKFVEKFSLYQKCT